MFENSEDLAAHIDSDDLEVTKDSVLVLKNIGPIGNPGMPEAGLIPIPRKLAKDGVTDLLRISDGRMSGTAGGTIVLHVSPEAAIEGSVFGIVETGNLIRVDAEKRTLSLLVEEEDIKERMKGRQVETKEKARLNEGERAKRGYRTLYESCVNQAHEGADFDFLTASGVEIHQTRR